MQQRIYLAGPDVFLPDAIAHGEYLKEQCTRFGFTGLFPLDNEIAAAEPAAMAEAIRLANIALIRQCDAVIANLSPFRGPEPDSGTVWEVGFAMALGKRVIGYVTDTQPLKQRTQQMLGLGDADRDAQGMLIEDFGLTHNLMFAHCVVARSFEGALECLQR